MLQHRYSKGLATICASAVLSAARGVSWEQSEMLDTQLLAARAQCPRQQLNSRFSAHH